MSINIIDVCKSVRDDDSIADTYETMAMAYYGMGNYEEALQACNKGIETSYKQPGLTFKELSL